ncbi:ribonuclease E inhibitor RraB [Lacimicrobium sp. SS2-24]|uniref:ribonuclease E inhibitor RraB n=1 Tax=Lacimicrobium sp. SS2-24 TaxID=2005569 RepID=UPI000B4AA973|nr:ribonuclease E inhibitor RraB [Lacimicrobium sp. SS2-24]
MNPEHSQWYDFNQETIQALLDDGSSASEPHSIEYHFASDNFDRLEKAAVDAFKAGFEVGDAEELILDDGGTLFCFDAVVERPLDLEQINQDTQTLLTIADKHRVHYDGWGTYFVE